MEEIDRLEQEQQRLLAENSELKQKLERKKYKIRNLKGNLTMALSQVSQVSQAGLMLSIHDLERNEKGVEQQVRISEEEPSIPYDENNKKK